MSNCLRIINVLNSFLIFRLAKCLVVGLVSFSYLAAQSGGQPHFRNYSTDDGLPSPEVHDIIQDQRGYIWIATDSGVSRFDGYQFKNFAAEEGLKNNVVFHLQEDAFGRIWMQTMSGNLYYYQQDSIHTYPYNHLITYHRNFFSIPNDFLIKEDSTLYTALYGIGILKITPDGTSELINLCHYNDIIIQESPEFERYLYSVVWRRTLRYLAWEETKLNEKPFMGIYSDTLRQSFILPRNPGFTALYGYVDNEIKLFDIRKELNVYIDNKLKTSIQLPTTVAEITRVENNFWVGFNDRQGVRFYRNQDAILSNNYQLYLSGKSISAICRDRAGGYWFGSLNDGIFYTPDLNLRVLHQENPGVNSNVLTLEKWKNDQLLFGTDNGVVYSLDTTGDIQEQFRVSGAIFDLWYQHSEDRLWIAGIPLQVMKGEKMEKIHFAPELNIPNWVVEKKLHPLKKKDQIIGSNGHGLDLIDRKRQAVTYSTLHTIIKERYLDVFEDFDGKIWVGNTRGLFQFRDSVLVPPAYSDPLFQLRVEDIDQLPDSTLVIGSKGGGLILWKEDEFRVIDKSKGLTTNIIENITVDTLQQIWVGTLNGLAKVIWDKQKDTCRVQSFSMAHGLPSNEINDLCAQGNWMYVATSKGIIKLPLIDTSSTIVPNLFLENISVNGKPRELSELASLKPSERNLQLTYLCINYKFDGQIQYRYRLSSEKDWSYTYDRSVNYAALAPGRYLFEVQAKNEDGNWSDPLSLSFAISSPLWKRGWFILLLAASLISLIYYWYRQHLTRLKKEASIEKEINELQRSALQAQMNPHFIFNCLNSIQNFIASGDKDSAMQYLASFAKLVRTTLKASLETTISLQEEVEVLENYLELEKLRFGSRFNYKIVVDNQLDPFDTTLPPLLVQPFVENAIIHGFSFEDRSRSGDIYLAYELIDDLLQVTIRDNGIGIEASKQKKEGKEKLRTSLGMQITQKRLSLQNQPQNGRYLKVKELVDPEGNACGTEVIIRIKF